MNRICSIGLIAIIISVMAGCAGGGGLNPILPDNPDNLELALTDGTRVAASEMNGHFNWGFWEITLDTEANAFEVVPIRGAMFHMNMSRILDQTPVGLSIDVNSINLTDGLADIDVTIQHPLPNSDFRGFDVRGIFMGPGQTIVSKTDPNLIYPGS